MSSIIRARAIATFAILSSHRAVAMSLPKRSFRYLSTVSVPTRPAPSFEGASSNIVDDANTVFDLSNFGGKLAENDKRREEAYAASRKLQEAIMAARIAGNYAGNEEEEDQKEGELDKIATDIVKEFTEEGASDNAPREANLTQQLEEYARYKSFRYFLKTGKLVPLSEFDNSCKLRDEEYLAGACIGLAQDLSRYAIGRATERDTSSVEMARDLTDSLMIELLKFDFRNGPLRKKYDGTKYALKTLETILYELSVTSGRDGSQDTASNPDNKRAKMDEPTNETSTNMEDVQLTDVKRVDDEEFGEIRARMEARDEMREKLIKRSRDGQKAAKQAIFALHRDDGECAKKLINDCELVIAELLPVTEKEPSLRYGSFSNVLEEYAEAKLYLTWLDEKRVANPSEFPTLQPVEYLGGLCDLTGEVGRFAVQRGTKRDAAGVKWCLETNLSILNALQLISLPNKLSKKVDPLRRSVEKLEQIMYELSLIQHGRNIPADSVRDEPGDEAGDA
jgi:predicted translin family RNA/ssDNA-binding protein